MHAIVTNGLIFVLSYIFTYSLRKAGEREFILRLIRDGAAKESNPGKAAKEYHSPLLRGYVAYVAVMLLFTVLH